jgi:hypothetical protein
MDAINQGMETFRAPIGTNNKFSHRQNSDGTIDSICHTCFSTVASARVEAGLFEKEGMHHCNPALVASYHNPRRSAHFSIDLR